MAPNFAPGSCDPRAAYALGMVIKMLRTSSSSSETRSVPQATCTHCDDGRKLDASTAVPLWQVQLDKLQRVLESPRIEAHTKQGLVALIEAAESVQDVWTLLDRVDDDSSDCLASAQTSASSEAALAHPSDALAASRGHEAAPAAAIPEELGCAICCCTSQCWAGLVHGKCVASQTPD